MQLITNANPQTWQELEILTRDILRECSMEADCQVSINLLRGQASVDVLAKDRVDGITHVIICECKNWSDAIPQAVVHGFRTVMHDAGANRGYIISKAGFQSGAIEAAKSTNVELVTFQEFQSIFFERWIKSYSWKFEKEFGGLNNYYEPFGIPGMGRINSEDEKREYHSIWEKFIYVGCLMPLVSPYSRMVGGSFPELPIDMSEINERGISVPQELAQASTYREFFKALGSHADEALRELRRRNPITRDKNFAEVERDD